MEEDSKTAPSEPDKDPETGIGSLASGALASFIDHLEARLELLRLEALEARSGFFRRLVLSVVGFGFLGIAYFVGVTGLIGWLSRVLETNWDLVALWAAAVHLVGGILLCWIAKRTPPTRLFRDSIAELRKDRDRLRQKTEPTIEE